MANAEKSAPEHGAQTHLSIEWGSHLRRDAEMIVLWITLSHKNNNNGYNYN